MKFQELFNYLLLEENIIRNIKDFSKIEKNEILSKLSDLEREQLKSGGKYMSENDWIIIRDYTLRKALERNKGTDPDLCAYTPGETLKLLQHPKILEWFSYAKTFRVPADKKKVIFVSCAASKRWGETAKSPDYKCYNIIKHENPENYWVTISEPLGIVPEKDWNTFPLYDNPGLFSNRGVSTEFWKTVMGKEKSYLYPFDYNAKNECIKILSDVIKEFYNFNKRLNPNLRFISMVDTSSEESTHTAMLNEAGILNKEEMFMKKPEARYGRPSGEERLQHVRKIAGM